RAFFVPAIVMMVLAGCESVTGVFGERADVAAHIATGAKMEPFFVETGQFELTGYKRFRDPSSREVSIYIEGDGLAFLDATTVSRDPTPRDPVSLRLAAHDPSANVAYLARPCQFQTAERLSRCNYAYWTNARFAPELVREMNIAVDAIVQASGADRVRLYGYSGGGVIAALLAGQRPDVVFLATAAAPLDHGEWTRIGRYSPLDRSLDAIDQVQTIKRVPQVHFAGADDSLVPKLVIKRFAERVHAEGGDVAFVTVPGTDHYCCWQDAWPALYRDWVRKP
ncbi:MAG: alpha/beta hydrolase, partial [Alphaproteobacteria bacterium]